MDFESFNQSFQEMNDALESFMQSYKIDKEQRYSSQDSRSEPSTSDSTGITQTQMIL